MVQIKYINSRGTKSVKAYMISNLPDSVDVDDNYNKQLHCKLDDIGIYDGSCLFQYWTKLEDNETTISSNKYVYIVIDDKLIRLCIMSTLYNRSLSSLCVMYSGDCVLGHSDKIYSLYNMLNMTYSDNDITNGLSDEQINDLIESCNKTSEQSE